jgi:hypothetical protein
MITVFLWILSTLNERVNVMEFQMRESYSSVDNTGVLHKTIQVRLSIGEKVNIIN